MQAIKPEFHSSPKVQEAPARLDLKSRLFEQTLVYKLWQAPFAEKKLRPILKHNDMSKLNRVLDLGCGPGTNAAHFLGTNYLGMDINPAYIDYANRKYGNKFVVADLTTYEASTDFRFDFILLNSFLHHVDDPNTDKILARVSSLLSADGHAHILDLVLPESRSIARFLAEQDRGDYPRPLERWKEIFSRHFEMVLFEPYQLTLFGVPLWNMVYFKGKAKR